MNQTLLTKKPERESNIELLRIVLMVMVILHHLIIRITTDTWDKVMILNAINTALMITVNCYMFISGYYGIKFKVKSLLSFIVQGVFYSVGTYIIYHFIISPETFSILDLFKSFLPLTYPLWWFFSAFVGVYLLSPFINKGIESLKAYQSGAIILILMYLFCSYPITGSNLYTGGGYGFVTMLFVYITARYCGKYIYDIKKSAVLHLSIYLITAISVLFLIEHGNADLAWRLIAYNSPLIIFSALLFFYNFKKFKLKSKIINQIASLTFGVYLIHETPDTGRFLQRFATLLNNTIENPFLLALALVAMAIIIFIVCACIEKVRQLICNPIVNSIYNKSSRLQLNFKTLIVLINKNQPANK